MIDIIIPGYLCQVSVIYLYSSVLQVGPVVLVELLDEDGPLLQPPLEAAEAGGHLDRVRDLSRSPEHQTLFDRELRKAEIEELGRNSF